MSYLWLNNIMVELNEINTDWCDNNNGTACARVHGFSSMDGIVDRRCMKNRYIYTVQNLRLLHLLAYSSSTEHGAAVIKSKNPR